MDRLEISTKLFIAFVIGLSVLFTSCSSSTTVGSSSTNIPIAPSTTVDATSLPAQLTITETKLQFGQELNVHFLDVGEGDAILIDDGSTDVLIDGGEISADVADLIKPYIHGDLEAVIATHYHSDHIGGQIDVFKDYHVDNAFWNGEVDTTQTYLEWKQAMDSSGAKEQIVKRGDVIQEGPLTFSVLDPVVTTDADPDQDCIVLGLQFGSKSFLFMADDGKPAEDNLLAVGLLQHYDVLKVGHHGSDTASSQEFLDVVKPEIAVYECGLNDQYGFPKAYVIARLKQEGATVYGTDTSGSIEVDTDGITTSIQLGSGSPTQVTAQPITPTVGIPASSLQVISVTSPVSPGSNATLVANTTPGAQCSITVNYKSGPSKASGLETKTADNSGNVSWTWAIGPKTTPGTWPIVVKATSNGGIVTATTNITVN